MANKVGAPVGNNNGQKNRIWTLAIQKALEQRSKGDQMKSLIELANKLIDNCLEGDMTALKEFGDRMEGKPQQSVAISGELNLTHEQALDHLASGLAEDEPASPVH
jgi:hypothetical protein